MDTVIFPINIGNAHWTAAAINFVKKRLEYYDSMGDFTDFNRRIFQVCPSYSKALVPKDALTGGRTSVSISKPSIRIRSLCHSTLTGGTTCLIPFVSRRFPRLSNGTQGTPHQDNGYDCGIFSCQTLEALARGKDLVAGEWEFGAENMAFFRTLMMYEIGSGTLVKRW